MNVDGRYSQNIQTFKNLDTQARTPGEKSTKDLETTPKMSQKKSSQSVEKGKGLFSKVSNPILGLFQKLATSRAVCKLANVLHGVFKPSETAENKGVKQASNPYQQKLNAIGLHNIETIMQFRAQAFEEIGANQDVMNEIELDKRRDNAVKAKVSDKGDQVLNKLNTLSDKDLQKLYELSQKINKGEELTHRDIDAFDALYNKIFQNSES